MYTPFNAWTGGSIIVGSMKRLLMNSARLAPSSRCGFLEKSILSMEIRLLNVIVTDMFEGTNKEEVFGNEREECTT